MSKAGLNIAFYSFFVAPVFAAVVSVFLLGGGKGIFLVVRDADVQGFLLLVGVVIGLSRRWSPYLYGALMSGIMAAVMHFVISGAPLPDDLDDLSKLHDYSLTFLAIIFYGSAFLTAILCVKGFLDVHEAITPKRE